jgi:hypothetical protein
LGFGFGNGVSMLVKTPFRPGLIPSPQHAPRNSSLRQLDHALVTTSNKTLQILARVDPVTSSIEPVRAANGHRFVPFEPNYTQVVCWLSKKGGEYTLQDVSPSLRYLCSEVSVVPSGRCHLSKRSLFVCMNSPACNR